MNIGFIPEKRALITGITWYGWKSFSRFFT